MTRKKASKDFSKGSDKSDFNEFLLKKSNYYNIVCDEADYINNGDNYPYDFQKMDILRRVTNSNSKGGSYDIKKSGYLYHYWEITVSKPNKKPEIRGKYPNMVNKDSSNGVKLSVNIGDANDDKMNITFYNASSQNEIGKIKNKRNGSYSINWKGISSDSTNHWYSNVTDGIEVAKSETPNFTTIDVSVNWQDNSDNEDGFKIYNNASGSYKQVEETGKDVKSYEDSSSELKFGKYTCYKVKAFNEFGKSGSSKKMY